jgi:hypothetical protein
VLHLNFAREAAGAAGTRHSLRPLFYGRDDFWQNLGRIAPRECGVVSGFDVIASQRVGAKRRPMTGSAKQSISPRKGRMDCFVAEFIIGPAEGGTRWLLAMTVSKCLGCLKIVSGLRLRGRR